MGEGTTGVNDSAADDVAARPRADAIGEIEHDIESIHAYRGRAAPRSQRAPGRRTRPQRSPSPRPLVVDVHIRRGISGERER